MQCENQSNLHIKKCLTTVNLGLAQSAHDAQPSQSVSLIPYLSISALWLGLVMAAIYCMMYLLASVLPAPLSPGGKNYAGF